MNESTAMLAALVLPVIGTLAIALCHRLPNLRETMSLGAAALTFVIVASLLGPVLGAARPSVQLSGRRLPARRRGSDR